MASINDILPIETLYDIIRRLPEVDHLFARQVCKSWREISIAILGMGKDKSEAILANRSHIFRLYMYLAQGSPLCFANYANRIGRNEFMRACRRTKDCPKNSLFGIEIGRPSTYSFWVPDNKYLMQAYMKYVGPVTNAQIESLIKENYYNAVEWIYEREARLEGGNPKRGFLNISYNVNDIIMTYRLLKLGAKRFTFDVIKDCSDLHANLIFQWAGLCPLIMKYENNVEVHGKYTPMDGGRLPANYSRLLVELCKYDLSDHILKLIKLGANNTKKALKVACRARCADTVETLLWNFSYKKAFLNRLFYKVMARDPHMKIINLLVHYITSNAVRRGLSITEKCISKKYSDYLRMEINCEAFGIAMAVTQGLFDLHNNINIYTGDLNNIA